MKVKNDALTLIELPDGRKLMPGEVCDLSEAHQKNPGVKILLAGKKLSTVSTLAPTKDRVLAEVANAKSEAELSGIAGAAELAGLQHDPAVVDAFKARVEALRAAAKGAPVPPPPVTPLPETKPEPR